MTKAVSIEPSTQPTLRIRYCPGCGWMLRATWLAQEVLTTFAQEIGSVSLEPVKETAGVFQVWLNYGQ